MRELRFLQRVPRVELKKQERTTGRAVQSGAAKAKGE
jgi:hypothetical protein